VRTTIIALGLLTIVIQWDEYFIQNISPKISKIAKCIPIVLCYAKIKLRKFVTNSEKYPNSNMPTKNKVGQKRIKFWKISLWYTRRHDVCDWYPRTSGW